MNTSSPLLGSTNEKGVVGESSNNENLTNISLPGPKMSGECSKQMSEVEGKEPPPPDNVIEVKVKEAISSLAAAIDSDDKNAVEVKFLTELERINNIVNCHKRFLQKRCEAVLDELLKLRTGAKPKSFLSTASLAKSPASSIDTENVKQTVRGIIYAYLDLHQSILNTKPKLKKATREADEQLGLSLGSVLRKKFTLPPWNQDSHDTSIVVMMSDIYQVIRWIEAAQTNRAEHETKVWTAPSSFERSTTKYWIADEKLTTVLLTSVQEVPLLVYAHKGLLTRSDNESTTSTSYTSVQEDMTKRADLLWGRFAVPITSVYFDSDDMALYKERIARREGAQLLRARWYGHKKPVGDQHIFLELKTHHEKWVNIKSVKERVTICEKDMKRFLSQDGQFSRVEAEEIIKHARSGNQKDSNDKEIAEATELLLRMRKLVVQHKLRPCVRSAYLRAAFQSTDSNKLRLTVDRDVTLVDESNPPPGEWCLRDTDMEQIQTMDSSNGVVKVPYSVFEVKLAGSDMPVSISDLETSGAIIESPKFSKFLTGAAAFNAKRVSCLPYWAENPRFAHVFNYSHDSKEKSHRGGIVGMLIPRRLGKEKTDDSRAFSSTGEESDSAGPVGEHANNADRRPEAKEKRDPWCLKRIIPQKRTVIAPKARVRIEPKSYFANERTFIQWISAALLLVTISAILLDFTMVLNLPSKASVELNIAAAAIVVYALFIYFRRMHLMSTGKAYGYIDWLGPIVLSCSLLVGIWFVLDLFDWRAGWKDSVLHEDSILCYNHNLSGKSQLEYQPSDVLVQGEMLLIPSLRQITAVHHSEHDDQGVHVLATIPRANLEGMTAANDRIFAISEDAETPELIELEWSTGYESSSSPGLGSNNLSIVNRWLLNTPGAEGIVYIPPMNENGVDGGTGRLFISSDDKMALPQDRASISVYDIPPSRLGSSVGTSNNGGNGSGTSSTSAPISGASTPAELTRRYYLNNKLFSQGLVDSKIGAMTYFEGVLYILHDNSMVVRAWDVDQGIMLSEWKLPRVGNGFDQQWEGIALERPNQASRLRGGDTATLLVHLALDSPPMVWTFSVKEGGTRGSIIFPACAAA